MVAEVLQDADLTTVDDAQLEKQIATPVEDTIPPTTVQAPETPAPVQDGEPQPAPVETPPQAPPETAEEKATRLEAQIRDKELMVQRLGNELGMMRKLASRPQIDVAKVREEIREQFQTDPTLAEQRLGALNRYVEEAERDSKIIAVPDLPSLVDTMAQIALAKGEKPEIVQAFRNDPLKVPVDVLKGMAMEARMYRYGETLKAEIMAKAPKSPDTARQGQPVIRANTPGGVSTTRDDAPRVTERDIASLSDAELEVFLAKGRV
jgi:hypothetical protein